MTSIAFISYYNYGCKIVAITFCAALILGTSVNAFACGTPFHAHIHIGTAGYGQVDGSDYGKYYHLTPGRAGLEVQNASGATFSVYLYKGWRQIDKCVNITSPTWRRFYNIPSNSSDYWLKIVAEGNSGNTSYIAGNLHDHGDPR